MTLDERKKFVADHMLGRLARWLRILGYDTLYPEPGPDKELIELAAGEGRLLLTRDKQVAETKKAETLYLESDDIDEQLIQVAKELDLELKPDLVENDDGTLVNRCGICNGILRSIPEEVAAPLVPPGVRQYRQDYWQCSGCNKIYWEGTHWDQISARLLEIKRKLDEA